MKSSLLLIIFPRRYFAIDPLVLKGIGKEYSKCNHPVKWETPPRMKHLLLCFLMVAGYCGLAQAAEVPKFKEYPAKAYNGREAPLRLDTQRAQQFRTRLKEAAKQPVNFGGRYVFVQWGTGTRCDTGALIDRSTGEVHFLPFSACNWAAYGRPFEFRKDSRLLVVAGQISETSPAGVSFFEFTGTEFKPLQAKKSLMALLFGGGNGEIEPSAGPDPRSVNAPSSNGRVNKDGLWKQNWETANHKPFDFVLLCYMATADTVKASLAQSLGDKFEAHFVLAGGNTENAELAIGLCDHDIRKLDYFDDESAYSDASRAFRMMAAIMDKDMLSACQSKECKDVARGVLREDK